jgi:RNA polymerase sigma factor (sigma-70 family)
MTSTEILQQALAGDKAAQAELVRILRPVFEKQATYTVWRVRGNTEDVKQLVGDIFVALYANQATALRRFDSQRGVPPEVYFRQFAQFQCRTYLRARLRQARHEQLTDSGDLPQPDEDEAGSEHPLEQAHRSEVLGRLRSELDASAYDLLERRYLQKQGVPEICAHLKITETTFYQRVHRLVKKLKEKGFVKE